MVVVPTVRWIWRNSTCISSRSLASRLETLVEQQHVGLDDQRARPARRAAAGRPTSAADSGRRNPPADERERVGDALGLLWLGDAAHFQTKGDVLGRRHVRKQRVGLEHDAEPRAAA